MNLKNYLTELKRRNVFKASIAYIIVAWIIIQVASIALPTFDAPPYFMKMILFLLVIGFPLNLVFVWAFELTPEGIKKTKEVNQKKSITPKTGSQLNKVIITALSIVVIFLLYNQFSSTPTKHPNFDSDGKTIDLLAVLPFSNTKPDPETDYFGFAIADQIIGDLIYLKNIIVRPSSSIRKYEKQMIDPVIAGEDLNVKYVLTGNYLKQANIIRLNVELINVLANEIIWREPIEVDYNNTFELQDIVAQKVVDGMNVKFTQKEISRIEKDIPGNPLAYEYYLRGVSYPFLIEGNRLAIDMLNKSIEIDSNYAPAYNALGRRIHQMETFGFQTPIENNRPEDYYLKALSINSELMSALSNLANFYTETDRTEEAVELTKQMLEINPKMPKLIFLWDIFIVMPE